MVTVKPQLSSCNKNITLEMAEYQPKDVGENIVNKMSLILTLILPRSHMGTRRIRVKVHFICIFWAAVYFVKYFVVLQLASFFREYLVSPASYFCTNLVTFSLPCLMYSPRLSSL